MRNARDSDLGDQVQRDVDQSISPIGFVPTYRHVASLQQLVSREGH